MQRHHDQQPMVGLAFQREMLLTWVQLVLALGRQRPSLPALRAFRQACCRHRHRLVVVVLVQTLRLAQHHRHLLLEKVAFVGQQRHLSECPGGFLLLRHRHRHRHRHLLQLPLAFREQEHSYQQ